MHKPNHYLKPLLLLGVACLGYLLFFAKEPEEVDVFSRYVHQYHHNVAPATHKLNLKPKQFLLNDSVYWSTRMEFATSEIQEYDRYADIPASLRAGLKSLTGCSRMFMEGEAEDSIIYNSPFHVAARNSTDAVFTFDSRPNLDMQHLKMLTGLDGCAIADMSYFGMTESSAVLAYRIRLSPLVVFCVDPPENLLLLRLDDYRITHSWELRALSPVHNRSEALAFCPPFHYTKQHADEGLLSSR